VHLLVSEQYTEFVTCQVMDLKRPLPDDDLTGKKNPK
jgi:hypothetical protein